MKTLPKFADIIGLYADDETDASTPNKPEDSQYTQQQIEDFCDELASLAILFPTSTANKTVQIIRHLQTKMKPLKSLERMCAAIIVHNEPLGEGRERYYIRGDMFRRIDAALSELAGIE
ncbi:hypothetical protein LCGC14_1722150 [marine sediment metagenome]|uniref:Uncharacterized protein n=1 Tax=marine sediment metagenome TaxID=412755 RepID=A0A0F9HZT0_9ZZZZ